MSGKKDYYLITCKSCGMVNRIPLFREGVQGLCGSCKAALPILYTHPVTVTEANFDSLVKGNPGPVLAEFWAPW